MSIEKDFDGSQLEHDLDATLNDQVARLQAMVNAGEWKTDLLKKQDIYNAYRQLASLGADVRNFGSHEFWWEVDDEFQQSHRDLPASHFFRIERMAAPRYARRFNTVRNHYSVNLINTHELNDSPAQLENIFDEILRQLLINFQPGDSTGIQINHPALDRPIYIPITKNSNLSGHKILTAIFRVIQSRTTLRIDDQMQIITVSIRPPTGTGRKRIIDAEKHLKKKHSIVSIRNNDYFCMARAIVTARAYIGRNESGSEYKTIKNGDQDRNTSTQKWLAEQLMGEAGLGDHNGPCGIPELEKIQAFIANEYQIKVFSHDHQGFIFRGESQAKQEIYLFFKDNHYDVITSMTGFLNRSYWCVACEVGYSNKEEHRCISVCPCCYSTPSCPNIREDLLFCTECNRYFRGGACYDNHKKVHIAKGAKKQKTESSVCKRVRKCKDCGEHTQRSNTEKHICGNFDCKICKKNVPKEGHLCFMQPLGCDDADDNGKSNIAEAKQAEKTRFVFFDFETTQCTEIGQNENGPIFQHETNLCICHVVCDDCRKKDLPDNAPCKRCGQRKRIFEGAKCLDEFCKWLFSADKKTPTTAIAHNAKGFDGQFLLEYLHRQGIQPTIINKGLELMSLSAGYVKVIDSLNFLPMALAALPKAFGETELAKGYFPHLFNTPGNWKYVGPWPAAQYYSPDSMKEGARTEFEKWHTQQSGKVFNFREEITKYCNSDVDILLKCCLKFRDIFIEKTTVDPFENSLTIASACNRVYRTLFLEEDTIGIIPHGGYQRSRKQSAVALKWLKWVSKERNIQIQHARNLGEYKIEPYNYYADGRHNNEIFEFHGCFWHGCPTCMENRKYKTPDQLLTAEEAFTRTVKRRLEIEAFGFTTTEMWECAFKTLLRSNLVAKQFVDSIKMVEPLDPRETFFGGRTNAVRLYDSAGPNEIIQYTDICSLYPFICKYGKFPIDHPEIITENFDDLTTEPYEGLIKCCVAPPRKLRHPVLPYRSNGKLTFPLCAACADAMQQEPCTHSDEERAIEGAWVSLELYAAVKRGYKVLKVHEVWHYNKVSQYDPELKEGGLFTEYINTFIKMKQEADGWPAWVQTDEDRIQYISNYEEREGVKLDAGNIVKNPGLRALAKLMLNSFWGKFGQRNNKVKTEYFKDPAKYFKHIGEAGRIIHSVNIVSDNMVAVSSSFEDDYVEVMANTNTVIAAYTTAQARLKLYSYIEQLGDRLCYFDTDSIIFKSDLTDNNRYQVPTGSYLGDMTDELKDYGPGATIIEFVSSGPKSYAYKVFSPATNTFHYNIKIAMSIQLLTDQMTTLSIHPEENMEETLCEYQQMYKSLAAILLYKFAWPMLAEEDVVGTAKHLALKFFETTGYVQNMLEKMCPNFVLSKEYIRIWEQYYWNTEMGHTELATAVVELNKNEGKGYFANLDWKQWSEIVHMYNIFLGSDMTMI